MFRKNNTTEKTNKMRDAIKHSVGMIEDENNEIQFDDIERKVIVLDVETTGLNSKTDKIVQFSAIKYNCYKGKLSEIDRIDTYIYQPEYDENKMAKDITFGQLTGITNEFLKTQKNEKEVFPLIKEFIGEDPIIAAYNTPFDYGFLVNLYINNGCDFIVDELQRLDVLVMARDLIPTAEAPIVNKKPCYKLGVIANMYGLDKAEDSEETIQFHNSMNDVVVTGRLLNTFIYEYVNKFNEKPVVKTISEVEKVRAKVMSINFWEGYRGYSRSYVKIKIGNKTEQLYYDKMKKVWCEGNEGIFDQIDMDLFIADVLELGKISDETNICSVKKAIADDVFLERYK